MISRLCTWAVICRSQSDSEGYSRSTPIFLPLQIWLARQDLSRRASKHYPLARKNGQPLPLHLTFQKISICYLNKPLTFFVVVVYALLNHTNESQEGRNSCLFSYWFYWQVSFHLIYQPVVLFFSKISNFTIVFSSIKDIPHTTGIATHSLQ